MRNILSGRCFEERSEEFLKISDIFRKNSVKIEFFEIRKIPRIDLTDNKRQSNSSEK